MNPDKLTTGVQCGLVAVLAFAEDVKKAKLVRALVPWKFYDPYYREVAQELEAYVEKYGQTAGNHLFDIVEVLKARDEKHAGGFVAIYADLLEQNERGIHPDYMLARARAFARRQRLKTHVQAAYEAIEKKTELGLDEAEIECAKAAKPTEDLFEAGKFFHASEADFILSALAEREEVEFPTGIEELDKRGLTPARETLHLLIGGAKVGKSWWLLMLAKEAMIAGKRVVYFSFELSEKLLERRALQTFFAMTKRPADDLRTAFFKQDELGRFASFEHKVLETQRPSFKDRDVESFIRGRLSALPKAPRVLFKGFPMHSGKVRDLDAFLDLMEARGFTADLVLVDYPGIMDVDPKTRRESLGSLVQELRGMAQRRKVAVAAVHQMNRAGAKSANPEMTDVGEDWSVVQTADVIIVAAKSEEEKELGFCRLKVSAREDEGDFTILVAQSLAMGQFHLRSSRMSPEYWDKVKERTGKQTSPQIEDEASD